MSKKNGARARRLKLYGELYQLYNSFFGSVAAALTEGVNPRISAALTEFFGALSVLWSYFVEKFFHERVLNVARSRLEFRFLFGKGLNFLQIAEFAHYQATCSELFSAVFNALFFDFLAFFIGFDNVELNVVVVYLYGFGYYLFNVGLKFFRLCLGGGYFTVPKELGRLIS